MICDVKHCKRESMLIYAAFTSSTKEVRVCEKHWEQHCDDKLDLRLHFFPNSAPKLAKPNYFKNL